VGEVSVVTDSTGKILRDPPSISGTATPDGNGTLLSSAEVMDQCTTCFEAQTRRELLEAERERREPANRAIDRNTNPQLAQLGLYRYQEYLPALMMALIRGTSNDSFSNALGTAPGSLSLSADLVLPGINGLRVGQLFWIDRIPTFYKIFGAFQILSIEDTIDVNGWKTNIHSRFNYLGKEWRSAVIELLKDQGINLTS